MDASSPAENTTNASLPPSSSPIQAHPTSPSLSHSPSTTVISSESAGRKRALDEVDDSPAPTPEPKKARLEPPSTPTPSSTNAPSTPASMPTPTPTLTRVPGPVWKRPYTLLSHDKRIQDLFDKHNISFGVQWEMARLQQLGKFRWDDVGDSNMSTVLINLAVLRGSSQYAIPKLWQMVNSLNLSTSSKRSSLPTSLSGSHPAFAAEQKAKSPWPELDKEQAALLAQSGAGLGCLDAGSDEYHGKVIFSVKVVWREKGPPELKLQPPELGASTRFARRFGSRRFIRMKNVLPPQGQGRPGGARMMDFFSNGFVFMGRVYKAFFEKGTKGESTVHLFETNESYMGRMPNKEQGDDFRWSLLQFVNWHNPLSRNAGQNMIKWGARFSLGLSTTVPGVGIAPENIRSIPDELSIDHAGSGKPASHHQLTDGAGFVNGTAMRMISQQMGWSKTPAALQARFGGSKGMFIIHPDMDFDSPPAIWIRDSQLKIKHGDPTKEKWDDAMLIVDVVRPPYLRSPTRLSAETLVALSDRGVPSSLLLQYMRDALTEEIGDLFDFENKEPARLWLTVSQEGRIIGARLKRAAGGSARAQGYGREEEQEKSLLDEDMADLVEDHSAPWWQDEISGCPSTIEDSALMAIDSGFTLQNSSYLRRKVEQILKQRLTSHIGRHRITIPGSAEGFVIPCPIPHVLKPNQVYLRLSRPAVDPRTGLEIDVVTGPVLLVRHPCKLPSDIQLVEAVDCPQLRHWKDVIITSVDTSQPRSLMSKLAGGDHDGDTVCMYWEESLVSNFRNASDEFLDPPPLVEGCFTCPVGTVTEFTKAWRFLQLPDKEREIQKVLLAGLEKPEPGIWSSYHDFAVYQWGLTSPQSVALAYMFTTALDAAKSGLRLKPDVEADFRAVLGGFMKPYWKYTKDELEAEAAKVGGGNRKWMEEKKDFVMQQLVVEGWQLSEEAIATFQKNCKAIKNVMDKDLAEPFESLVRPDPRLTADFQNRLMVEASAVEQHVRSVRAKHRAALNPRTASGQKDFSNRAITTRQDILRSISLEFVSGPPPDKVPILSKLGALERVRASAAYIVDWREDEWSSKGFGGGSGGSGRGTNFPFDVAMRVLGDIKAKASAASAADGTAGVGVGGGWKTVKQEFYDRMVLHKMA